MNNGTAKSEHDEQDSCLFVIFGATGDLSKKKLIPALYNLLLNKKLGNFAVIGIAREQLDKNLLLEDSKKHFKFADAQVFDSFQKKFYYFPADFHNEKKFEELGRFVKTIEKNHNLPGNRIFYLATLPEHFKVISSNIRKYGLAGGRKAKNEKNARNEKNKKWSRVVFEKPFGNDLKSAKKLNECIRKVFDEKQIYRIDHYLGKELAQNISVLRFTNTVIEPLWNRKYIDHVQIILSENFGIEGRGVYYDEYGAIKDVVQNHMMQLLCLTAMDSPFKLTGEHIRNEKVKVLKSVKLSRKDVVAGQYAGYLNEKNIRKNSKTETFAAIKLFVSNKRWKGVPFYFITGKNMKDKITSVYVQFKEAPCLLFEGVCNFMPNYLVIQIQPDEGFYLQVNAKVPAKTDISAIKMDFCHACTFGPNTPEAYENLLADVVQGDQSVFIRNDEIELSWKIIDRIKKSRIYQYEKGSYPKKAKELVEKDNRYWHLVVK